MSNLSERGPADILPFRRRGREPLPGAVPERGGHAESPSPVRPLAPEAVAALVQALADRDPSVAGQAAAALRTLGPQARQPLLDALKAPLAERAVLKAVARTLASLWPDSE